jgi:hypothetical protein
VTVVGVSPVCGDPAEVPMHLTVGQHGNVAPGSGILDPLNHARPCSVHPGKLISSTNRAAWSFEPG